MYDAEYCYIANSDMYLTSIHSIVAFSLQQWVRGRLTLLRYAYVGVIILT